MTRQILLVVHGARSGCSQMGTDVIERLRHHGISVTDDSTRPYEMVLALGGDGTMLAAAEAARSRDVPLLGVNFGHMGFLTDVDADEIDAVCEAVVARSYRVEERMALSLSIHHVDGRIENDWAINEAAIVAIERAQPAHLAVGIDDRAISTYGADGIIVATPTGSTAYSYSAGGPIVWPDVEAVVMAPLSAHGLFTRPLVISPSSLLEVRVLDNQRCGIHVWCDGRRRLDAEPGARIRTTRSHLPVRLAQISNVPFSGRLVHKFNLPIAGWRTRTDDR